MAGAKFFIIASIIGYLAINSARAQQNGEAMVSDRDFLLL